MRVLDYATNNKNNNLLYYTSIMDSYNHNYGGLDSKTLKIASCLLADIKGFIDAIESSDYKEHYVLIVSSDHGAQLYFGEDEVCNHGCEMENGNEAFLYVYSYGAGSFEDWISNQDVGAIVSGYIQGARIPLDSNGWPKPLRDDSNI